MEIKKNLDSAAAAPAAPAPLPADSGRPKLQVLSKVPEAVDRIPLAGEGESVSVEELQSAVKKLNQTARVFNTKIKFEFDNERDNSLRVFIVGEGGKVVRSIPPDEILDVSSRIQNAIGVLFDRKA